MLDPRTQAQVLVSNDADALHRLWVWYRGNGGDAGLLEFDAYLYQLIVLDPFDLKILSWALEDYIVERS
jgi:hypothetical protein